MTDKSLLDALTQHQAYLYRASTQTVNELLKLFDQESKAMLSQLSDLLNELSDAEKSALAGGQYTTPNLREIRDLIAHWLSALGTALPEVFTISIVALAVYEVGYQAKFYDQTLKAPEGERLYQRIKKIPLAGGALIDELFARIAINARQKVEYAIRDGINTGKSNQDIITQIKGRKRLNYEDGLLHGLHTDIDRIVRTVRSHVSNQSYLYAYTQLGFEYVRFVATLDGRTSKLCASLDTTVWKIDDPAKRVPPLHYHCRSILVAVDKDGKLVGQRPFVMDERRVKDIPKDEREHLIGQLDANVSFKAFFKLTDDFFQKEWLGAKRYQLYKAGKFDFDKFFDPEGNFYTLDQLKVLDAQTFKALGL
ncbi:MAG: minor capsid protein [Acinetobacter sp.]